MSRKWWNVIAVIVMLSMLLMTAGCAAPAAPAPAQPAPAEATKAPEAAAPAVDPNWAAQPAKDKCTVVLSVESGAQEKTFQKFAPDLLKEMNIDLQVVAHPFSEQYRNPVPGPLIRRWTIRPPLLLADVHRRLLQVAGPAERHPAGRPGSGRQKIWRWMTSRRVTSGCTATRAPSTPRTTTATSSC